jgi:hypothetical protein
MDHDHIQRFGFTEEQAREIIGLYNGILWPADQQPDSYRDVLLLGLQDRLDGVNVVEDIVDEGRVQGEVYKSFEELERVRHHYRVLVAKVAALTEDQAREIHTYAVGFWEGKRDG